jgi:transposase
MRGGDERSGALFSYVDLEARVGEDHPLRTIRGVVNEALAALSGEFSALLRAMLLQAFYSVRSERQLMERLKFDLLFRWFVGIGVDDVVWDHSTFSKNRDRLLEGDVAAKFLSAVLAQPRVKRLLSSEHFSVDGTLTRNLRQLRDMRRSGVMEAFAGGGNAHGVAKKFSNSIDRSRFLFETYNPVDQEKVRQTDSKVVEQILPFVPLSADRIYLL